LKKTEKPSKEHQLFAKKALEIFGPTLDQFDFKKHRTEIGKYSTTIIFRKFNLYVKISGSTYPKDYPDCYNVILGEGDSEDFWEYDWNSVTLCRIKAKIDPKSKYSEHKFPFGESIEYSLKNANEELIKYGITFLNGDLELFQETRKEQNREREPYNIHSPDKNGKYKTTRESISFQQKKKYS